MTVWHKSLVRDIFLCAFLGAWSLAGNKKPETRPMKLGTLCHELRQIVLDSQDNPIRQMEYIEDDETREIMENTYRHDPFLGESDCSHEWYTAIDPGGYHLYCNKDQEEENGAWIAGTLDRIMWPVDFGWRKGLLVVEDYKTGWIESQFRPEIVFYLLLAWAYCRTLNIPVERVRFVYFYGRSGRRVPIEYTGTFEELLIEAKQIIKKCELLLENPVPMPGDHCTFCPLIHTECPLFANLPASNDPKIGKLIDQFMRTGELVKADAPAVGLALQALDSKVSDLKVKFKEWIESNGPVRIGEKEWKITEADGDSWDQEIVWQILREAPDDAKRTVFAVNTTRIKKLRKGHPDLMRKLYRYARLPGDPVERFGLTKV